jgi:hypothetical protein
VEEEEYLSAEGTGERRGEAKIPGVQNSDFGFSRLSGHDES